MSQQQAPIRIAVYGTLKQNQANHVLLKGCRFLGRDRLHSIALYDLGPFPAAQEKRSDGVVVEVYEVDESRFALLDELEGYNVEAPETGLYTRKLFDTSWGEAWLYLFNGDLDQDSLMSGGNWARSAASC